MKWRRLAWLVILLLILTAGWAAMELKGIREKIASVESGDDDSVFQQLTSLQERITDQRKRLDGLEEYALWPSGSDPMSWLTQQADEAGVQVIGVEHLPIRVSGESV